MTIKQLRAAFKRANKRVDKTVARYERYISKLYMPLKTGEIVNVYDKCYRGTYFIPEPATQLSWEFYRRGRNGEFYEKPQPKREGFTERAWDNYRQAYQLVGDDWLTLRDMEHAIDKAVDEREKLLAEFENTGLNPWTDDDLWK